MSATHNSITIEVKDHTYKIGRIDAITQFHLVRKLSPVLAALGVSLTKLKDGTRVEIEEFFPVLGVIMQIMAAMPKEDVDYILATCLGVVTRQQEGNKWAPVSQGTRMMFEDIELPEILRLVFEALRVNLANFLTGLGDETASPGS